MEGSMKYLQKLYLALVLISGMFFVQQGYASYYASCRVQVKVKKLYGKPFYDRSIKSYKLKAAFKVLKVLRQRGFTRSHCSRHKGRIFTAFIRSKSPRALTAVRNGRKIRLSYKYVSNFVKKKMKVFVSWKLLGASIPSRRVIRFSGKDLSMHKGKVFIRPGSRRKQSTYKSYIFSKSNFSRLISLRNKKIRGAKILINIIKTVRTRYKPAKNMSQPKGGFRFIKHHCRLIKVLNVSYRPVTYKKGRVIRLYINKKNLSMIKMNGDKMIRYAPGRNRKSAVYKTYYFPYKNFITKLGPIPRVKNHSIRVKIVKEEYSKYTPSGFRSSHPAGGFRLYSYFCRVVGK